jgi:hypothetical protein
MRASFFLTSYVITAILAFFFCVCGHFFMTAYTDYHITRKKLELLSGQEQFFQDRVKALERKNSALAQVSAFMDHAAQSGLLKQEWDEFWVDLTDEPLSFSQLSRLLDQACTSENYYFIPESLVIRPGQVGKQPEGKEGAGEIKIIPEKQALVSGGADTLQGSFDAVVSLKGLFLVRNRGQDE